MKNADGSVMVFRIWNANFQDDKEKQTNSNWYFQDFRKVKLHKHKFKNWFILVTIFRCPKLPNVTDPYIENPSIQLCMDASSTAKMWASVSVNDQLQSMRKKPAKLCQGMVGTNDADDVKYTYDCTNISGAGDPAQCYFSIQAQYTTTLRFSCFKKNLANEYFAAFWRIANSMWRKGYDFKVLKGCGPDKELKIPIPQSTWKRRGKKAQRKLNKSVRWWDDLDLFEGVRNKQTFVVGAKTFQKKKVTNPSLWSFY